MNKQKMFIIPFVMLLLLIAMIFVGINNDAQPVNAVIDDNIINQYNSSSVFEVDTPEDWGRLCKIPSTYTFSQKTIVLNCDIDLKMYPFKFAYFYGSFEGNGHSLYNAEQPLFSELNTMAIIKDLHFYNINIYDQKAAVAISNSGIIQNVSAHGYLEGDYASGLVNNNFGTIRNCISYLTLKDSTLIGQGNVGGIAYFNGGIIEESHYFGNQIITNNVRAGGIAVINAGTIQKCSSRVDFDVDIIEGVIDAMEVGGITANNGFGESYLGIIKNSFAIINTSYNSEELDFVTRKNLSVSGLIANSIRTQMSYCYSVVSGQGNLFGAVSMTAATPITETYYPAEPEQPYEITTGYEYHGSDSIQYCFSSITLQPTIIRDTHDGPDYEILPITNQTINHDQIINNQSQTLVDLLQNEDALWYGQNGQLAECSTLLQGDGSSSQPYIIKTKEDVFKVQGYMYNQSLSYYFSQQADIDFNYVILAPFDLAMNFTSNYNGNDFVMNNYNANALFQRNTGQIQNLGFIGGEKNIIIAVENTYGVINNCYSENIRYGTNYTNTNIYNNREFIKAETFGYTGIETITDITQAASFASGSGTNEDPYIIETSSQLARIGLLTSSQYVELNNNIVVNKTDNVQKHKLNISGFTGNFNGNGYSIIGLINEPLVGVLTGAISNVNLRGIRTSMDYAGIVANTITELGKVEKVEVYGSLSGDECGGIAGSNAGEISFCISNVHAFGLNSAGISGNNTNTINNCINNSESYFGITSNENSGLIDTCYDNGQTFAIYNGMGDITQSITKSASSIELWNNNEIIYTASELPIAVFRNHSIYSLDTWGYTVGNSAYPELKRQSIFYKQDLGNAFFNKSLNYNRKYSPDTQNDISEIEHLLIINNNVRSQITFNWYYNDAMIDTQLNPYIKTAGIYKVYATYPGSNYIHEFTYVYQINISKATLPTPDFYGTTGIAGVHKPYFYDGEVYDIMQIKANNLNVYGITLSDYIFVVTKSGVAVENIVDSGVYSLTVIISSVNYTSYTGSLEVTISKPDLSIEMHSYEINYLAQSPDYTYSLFLQTNATSDQERIEQAYQNAEQALSQAMGNAVCDYMSGDDIGEYTIGYEVNLENYNIVVNQGVLTVNPLSLTDENIVFVDIEQTYSGEVIAVEAQITDEQITPMYFNNQNINVGNYSVRAVFSKPNYLDLELFVTLTINKASLIIKPSDLETEYGQSAPDFMLAEIAFLGQDDENALQGEPEYQCSYNQGDDIGSYDIILSGFVSANYDIIYETGTLTVNKAYMTEVFFYPDISVTFDGQPKTNPIDLMDYQTTVSYTYYLDDVLLYQLPENVGEYQSVAYVWAINENYQNTSFTAILTINKRDLDVNFLDAYSLVYDGQTHTIDYEGSLPEGEEFTIEQAGKDAQNNNYNSFKDAAIYQVYMSFIGNENYNALTIWTTLTIEAASLEITIISNAVYDKTNKTPEYQFVGDIFEYDTINIEWRYSIYGYSYENSFTNAINAGKYHCYPKSLNKNYNIINTPDFTIEKLLVMFSPNKVEFFYGDYIDFVYESRLYTSGRTYVIEKGYFVDATSSSVDVEYYYNGPDAGVYSVTGVKDTSNYDFELLESQAINKVYVQKRVLTSSWNAFELSVEYNGQAQMPFEFTIGNYVSGETVSTTLVSNGNNKDAGEYIIFAELINSSNYVLNEESVTLTITQAPLSIKANDIYVVQGTENVNFSYIVSGLKAGETLSSLGKQLVFNCSYSSSSPVGLTLPISLQPFVLDNYDIEFVTGTLYVTANSYPAITMTSRTYVYDGNIKALVLDQSLPVGAVVSYQNNYKKDAGVYNVGARIVFPNSTIQNISAVLTIIKATPILTVENLVIPYYVLAKLQNNDIIGVAKINDNEVPGFFSWKQQYELKRGINIYTIVFTPEDSHNINTVETDVNVDGKTINVTALVFDNENIILTEDMIHVDGQTTITISNEYPYLVLYLNSEEKESITLNNSGNYKIELKYNGATVFSKNYEVIIKGKEDDGEVPPTGLEVLTITSGIMNDEESLGNIILDEEGTIIRIAQDFANDYELLLNGNKVSFIVLNGDEEYVDIELRYKGVLIYSKTFDVSMAPPQIQQAPTKDTWLWAKISGGVVGGIALILIAILIIRKTNIIGKKGFNPYEAAEKKKNKLKKKFK